MAEFPGPTSSDSQDRSLKPRFTADEKLAAGPEANTRLPFRIQPRWAKRLSSAPSHPAGLSHVLTVAVRSGRLFTITEREGKLNMSTYEAPSLYDIVDLGEMVWLAENGYVREQDHPTEPLRILNYTNRAQVTPQVFADYPSLNECRGLIYNTTDGTVVARPFPKFWNYGQAGAAEIPLDAPVIVTDKVDGSLGIVYREPNSGQLAVATRGSFTSDQAIHATAVLRRDYAHWEPEPDETVLFEIVYPENRIVLNYGQDDDLFLLGAVEIRTGRITDPDMVLHYYGWQGPRAKMFVYRTLAEALAAEPRENAEGMVVRWPHLDGDRMVKIKQEDYVALHRIVTGLNERTVWEHLKAGKHLDELLEPLPDEFHLWVLAVAVRLTRFILDTEERFQMQYLAYVRQLSEYFITHPYSDAREVAKVFAGFVKDDPNAWAMFALKQGKDIEPKLWELAKPEPGKNPSNTPLEA